MITQIKNAQNSGAESTKIKYSKINLAILEILKNKKIIKNYEEIKKDNQKYPNGISIELFYKNLGNPPFENITRISKPGRRIYISASKINYALRGKSEILISTSKGIMNGTDAKKHGLGGELLFEVIK